MTVRLASASGARVNRDRSARRIALAVLPLGIFAAAAAAQTNEQAALPTPAAPAIVLPRVASPASSPVPSTTPRPAPRASPPARPAPRPGPTTRPSPAVTPRPPTLAATPSPTPAPARSAAPSPRASAPATGAAATADPTPSGLARTPDQIASVENPKLWPAIALAVALVAGLGYLLRYALRTRRARRAEAEAARRPQVLVAGSAASPSAGSAPAGSDVPTFWTPSRPATLPAGLVDDLTADEPLEPVAPPLRPRITYTLHPRRAGLNLVSATADVELTVRNEGDGDATEVAVMIRLLAGRAGQEEELGALFAGDATRPALPPFALAPGEQKLCRTTVVLPRAEIAPIPVGDRPMFVPVIVADVRYGRPDGGRGQTAAAYVIGAPRAGSDKLSPFWLDAQPRMREEVEARPHGLSVES